MYFLAHGDPDPLIEKLHPDPDSIDREKLRGHIEGESHAGLLSKAVHVARLIRGADVNRGAPPETFEVGEQISRWRIVQARRAGHSDQQIIERLAEEEGISISQAELEQLAELDPPNPSP